MRNRLFGGEREVSVVRLWGGRGVQQTIAFRRPRKAQGSASWCPSLSWSRRSWAWHIPPWQSLHSNRPTWCLGQDIPRGFRNKRTREKKREKKRVGLPLGISPSCSTTSRWTLRFSAIFGSCTRWEATRDAQGMTVRRRKDEKWKRNRKKKKKSQKSEHFQRNRPPKERILFLAVLKDTFSNSLNLLRGIWLQKKKEEEEWMNEKYHQSALQMCPIVLQEMRCSSSTFRAFFFFFFFF